MIVMYGLGGAATALFIHLFRRPAEQAGLIDRPAGRKQHDGPVPLTGGFAIFASLIPYHLPWQSDLLLIAMGLILVIGLVDDLYGLRPCHRLVAEILVALLMALWGGQVVDDLGDLLGFGILHLGALSVPFTIVCVVGFVNAFNMIDGVDGLAAGIAAVIMLWLIIAARLAGIAIPHQLLVLLAAVVGFMWLNARHPLNPRAVVFLGDSGSMLLGVGLAWYAIALSKGPDRALLPISVVWVLGLPVIDTLRVMIRRLCRRQNPFKADRDHFHHVLLKLGFSPGQVAWLMTAIAGVFGGIGVLGPYFGVLEPTLTYAFLTVAACFWAFIPALPALRYAGREAVSMDNGEQG